MVREVCGANQVKKIESIPLSNDTVRARISVMSNDINDQVIISIKAAGQFSMQLDESTDLTKNAQLLVYARFPGSTDLEEAFLFCRPLLTTTKGLDIFELVDSYLKDSGLNWNQCFSICTDGAPAMLGCQQGFTTRAKAVNPEIINIHCMLHRENLASDNLSEELSVVMQDVTKVVNYIKTEALNSRIFKQLCEEYDNNHIHLLYYSDVRWLSRGKALQRITELRNEVEEFLLRKQHHLANRFSETKWLMQLAYLSDIFAELNILNASMQGRNQTLVDSSEKISAFIKKLKLWSNKVSANKTASFPILNLFIENEEDAGRYFPEVKTIIVNHMKSLVNEFQNYFGDEVNLHEKYNWVTDPFQCDVEELQDDIAKIGQLQEQLIDIQSDNTLKFFFKTNTITQFWTEVKREKLVIGNEAFKVLLPFPTSYLCEAGFSALTAIKTKYRNRLAPEHDMRCALSTKVKPRFEKLSEQQQAQGSH